MILFFLIIFIYIYLLYDIYIKKFNSIEKFTGFLDTLSNFIDDKENTIKLNNNITVIEEEQSVISLKYIYLSKESNQKYLLYDKDSNLYMKIGGKFNDYEKKISIKDIKNNIIGNLISEKYNTLTFKLNFYNNKKLNISYIDNYHSVKVYLENDDKVFYIIYKNSNYYIYLFNNLEIGIVKRERNKEKNIYKIMVYEDYKNYLNLIALGLITLFM